MEKARHTPLPWRVASYGEIQQEDTGSSIPLVPAFVEDAFSEGDPQRPEALANAAFIATACNAYYIYREALEKLCYLGNGNVLGNSEGNMIARVALAKLERQ